MEEKRIYVLAQFDDKTQSKFAEIYGELVKRGFKGSQTPDVPYHFTLDSFETAREAEIVARAAEVAASTDSFSIRFTHIGFFGLNVLFLAPAMNYELLMLHDAMAPEAPASGAHNWAAHATVLIDEPEAIQEAAAIVTQSLSPMVARIETIGIYEFFPKRFITELKLR